MPDFSKKIVYLSQAQYQELITNSTITVDGVTVTYNANDIYVTPQAEPVMDVQVNGTSVTSNGVANVPTAAVNVLGAAKVDSSKGITVDTNVAGLLAIVAGSDYEIKNGNQNYRPIVPTQQHKSTFYGLAKAAGDSTQSSSNNAVGTYTPEAKGSIMKMIGVNDIVAPDESDYTADRAYAVGECFTMNGILYRATAAIAYGDTITSGTNCTPTTIDGELVKDIQVNGTSILSNGVANVPIAGNNNAGVVKVIGQTYGVAMSGQILTLSELTDEACKNGTNEYRALKPYKQHQSVFYGLAKAAGADMKDISSTTVGVYPEAQKSAISTMLSGSVAVSGTTPTITALPGISYECGEVVTLDVTLPSSGCIDVIFESGSTPTVLTITTPTGYTVEWADGFDATSLEANTVYEINIKMTGTKCLGVAGAWATT